MIEQKRCIIIDGKLIQFLGGVKDVVIPNGVLIIGPGAFRGYDVESVFIPDGVLEIGNNCFDGCKNLKTVRIPSSIRKISDTAFRDTKNVQIICKKGTYAWEYLKNNNSLRFSEEQSNNISKTTNSTHHVANVSETHVYKPDVLKVEPKAQNNAPVSVINKNQNNTRIYLNNEIEYAQILGCNVGERPWTMRHNFFGKATRLANRISKINNQDLLIKIANEAYLTEIMCAAIKNIVNQEVLIKYSKHPSTDIRLASIQNLTNQEALKYIATTDNSSFVRESAIKKVKDEKTLKHFFMNADRITSLEEIRKITKINDLRELAIFAHHSSVRKYAANLLPKDSFETKLLIAAAEISEKIEPYAIERFENAVEQLKGHSDVLETVAISYPFPGVRYLARKREAIKPKDTKNMEELLRSKTPSSSEMQQREKINHCRNLLSRARMEAQEFSRMCNRSSEVGKTSCQMKIHTYQTSLKTFEDADLFVRLLSNELHKTGFSHAFIKKEPDYFTHYDNTTELKGFNFYISTNW